MSGSIATICGRGRDDADSLTRELKKIRGERRTPMILLTEEERRMWILFAASTPNENEDWGAAYRAERADRLVEEFRKRLPKTESPYR